jgi:hypothetical protein
MEEQPQKKLIPLVDAAAMTGIPYVTLKRAIHAKWRRLEAEQVKIGNLLIWHVTPEALESYTRQHTAAPWRTKHKPE